MAPSSFKQGTFESETVEFPSGFHAEYWIFVNFVWLALIGTSRGTDIGGVSARRRSRYTITVSH